MFSVAALNEEPALWQGLARGGQLEWRGCPRAKGCKGPRVNAATKGRGLLQNEGAPGNHTDSSCLHPRLFTGSMDGQIEAVTIPFSLSVGTARVTRPGSCGLVCRTGKEGQL